MKLDFKHFKKVKEDEGSVTLRHPRGHEIKVAKKALNKDMQTELGAVPMWEGGQAKPKTEQPKPPIDETKAKEVQDSFKKALGFDSGGQAPGLAELQEQINPTPYYEQAPSVIPDMKLTSDMQAEPPAPVPQNMSLPQPQAAPVQPDNSGMQAGANKWQSGIAAQAKAEGDLGAREAAIAHEAQAKQAELMNTYQTHSAAIDKELSDVMNDYKAGHIDPNHFMSSKSATGRVSTAIGLILGGMGAGIAGGENQALKFLNQQIDRDVEGQKAEMDKKVNVMRGLQQQYGNLKDATDMYRVLQTGVYATKLQEEAAKSKDPLAKARAQQMSGELMTKTAPLIEAVKTRRTIMDGLQRGIVTPEQAVPHLVPKEHQNEVFKEIKAAADTAQIHDQLMKHFDDAAKENTLMRTGFGIRTPPSILAMRAMNLPMIHDKEGRVNEFEQKTLGDIEPKQGDTDSKVAAKRQAYEQFITQKESAPTAAAFGITLPKQRTFNKR